MSNVKNRQNAIALNNLLNSQGSLFRLQKFQSNDNYLTKQKHFKPLRTEKSSTLSLVKSDSLITHDNKNFFKTSTSLTKMNNIVNFQKQANEEQHKKVIKHLLTDQSYLKLNKISLEGNRVRTLQTVKPELQNQVDQKQKMKDLREKIKIKLQQRDKAYMLKNAQSLNNLQLKLSNLLIKNVFENVNQLKPNNNHNSFNQQLIIIINIIQQFLFQHQQLFNQQLVFICFKKIMLSQNIFNTISQSEIVINLFLVKVQIQ